ncbi:MAG: hypothetical protein P4L57_11020 [Rhizomicrobium sp.]|nr:hypothetical protein [Rhizomicrobium sp.]
MLAIGHRNRQERAAATLVPDGPDNILVLGEPFNPMRYSLAVTSVLAVVSVVLLSLNYY